jgi:hypothetical protein
VAPLNDVVALPLVFGHCGGGVGGGSSEEMVECDGWLRLRPHDMTTGTSGCFLATLGRSGEARQCVGRDVGGVDGTGPGIP